MEGVPYKLDNCTNGYDERVFRRSKSIYPLNPLNSTPLLAYTRQWDKMCDSSSFRNKNAEILSYFLVFTLLETAFIQ